jgi:hypothetical protein
VNVVGNAFLVKVELNRRGTWFLFDSNQADSPKIFDGMISVRENSAIGTHGGSPTPILEALDGMLDVFLNDYLKANKPTTK